MSRAALLLALLPLGASALGVNGVEVGQPTTPNQLHSAFSLAQCPWDRDAQAESVRTPGTCHGYAKVGGSTMYVNVTVGADGTVRKITAQFGAYAYDSVLADSIKQWGPQSGMGSVPMQTAGGARVLVIEQNWKAPGVSASVINYALELTHGILTVEADK